MVVGFWGLRRAKALKSIKYTCFAGFPPKLHPSPLTLCAVDDHSHSATLHESGHLLSGRGWAKGGREKRRQRTGGECG